MKYTILELAQEINRSRPVTIKWAERMGYNPTTKLVKNRELKAYELTNSELEELKHAINEEEVIEVDYEADTYPAKSLKKDNNNTAFTPDKLIEFTSQYVADIKELQSRASYYEGQTKLIETSEARKDARIRELEATIKQLQAENEELKNKKWWQVKII